MPRRARSPWLLRASTISVTSSGFLRLEWQPEAMHKMQRAPARPVLVITLSIWEPPDPLGSSPRRREYVRSGGLAAKNSVLTRIAFPYGNHSRISAPFFGEDLDNNDSECRWQAGTEVTAGFNVTLKVLAPQKDGFPTVSPVNWRRAPVPPGKSGFSNFVRRNRDRSDSYA